MKKNLFFLCLTFSIMANAQITKLKWAKSMGGKGTDIGYSITTDASGNVYTTGWFQNNSDFDPDSSKIFTMNSSGSYDLFISKLDASGHFVWAKQFAGNLSDLGYSIAVDGFKNVYVTGSFGGTTDFDPGAGTFNLTAKNNNGNIFISKLDSNGNFLWAKQFSGTFGDRGYSIAVDMTGNIYTTGYFLGTTDFDPGADSFYKTALTSYDVFVSKLNKNGSFLWAKVIGGSKDDEGHQIAVSATGKLYVTGNFRGIVDFNPGSGTFKLSCSDISYDMFILKLDTSGNFIWAKQLGGSGNDYGISIALGKNDTIYTTGSFSGRSDYDPGPGTFNLNSFGSSDVFISKLDSSGNFVWAKNLGGKSDEIGYAIAIDTLGNVYSTGYFNGLADFDPGIGISNLTSNGSSSDIFISKLDSSGNFVLARQFGSSKIDYGTSIKIDQSGNIYTTGFFSDTVDFDPNLEKFILKSEGFNIFITKIGQPLCLESNATIYPKACNNFISPSGKFIWTSSNTYKDTILNKKGCDSLITIHLIITNVDTSITQIGASLTSNANSVNYQWLDCKNGFSIINGASNKVYTPTVNGSYAVKISKNGCIDTSFCYGIETIGIFENQFLRGINIHPNPTTGILNIECEGLNIQELKIQILNSMGQFVMEETGIQHSKLNIKHIPEGLYLLRVIYKNEIVSIEKIVKQ
jgi:hypothetical protein